MSSSEPPERDIKDFEFVQLCKFRVSPSSDSVRIQRGKLLACSSQYGLLIYATSQGLSVVQTSELRAADENLGKERTKVVVEDIPVLVEVALPSPPISLDMSGDGQCLAVVVREMGQLLIQFYDVRCFADKNTRPSPFGQSRVNASPTSTVLDISWNPAVMTMLAVCTSDGNVELLDITDMPKVTAVLPAAAGATCFCWSPKGKQLLVGKKDGSLAQYDHGLVEKKKWACPSVLNGPHTVVDVVWQSTYVFLAAYLPAGAQPGDQPVVVMTSSNKENKTSYTSFDDVCFGNGEERRAQYFFHFVQKWDVIVMASSNATEATIVGRNLDDKTSWEHWNLEDSSRAELPLTAEKSDSYPMGLAVDYSPQQEIIISESKRYPPSPVLYLLSTDGLLLAFHMVYTHKEAPPTTSPAQQLSSAGARRGAPGQVLSSQPTQPAATPSPPTPATTPLATSSVPPAAMTTPLGPAMTPQLPFSGFTSPTSTTSGSSLPFSGLTPKTGTPLSGGLTNQKPAGFGQSGLSQFSFTNQASGSPAFSFGGPSVTTQSPASGPVATPFTSTPAASGPSKPPTQPQSQLQTQPQSQPQNQPQSQAQPSSVFGLALSRPATSTAQPMGSVFGISPSQTSSGFSQPSTLSKPEAPRLPSQVSTPGSQPTGIFGTVQPGPPAPSAFTSRPLTTGQGQVVPSSLTPGNGLVLGNLGKGVSPVTPSQPGLPRPGLAQPTVSPQLPQGSQLGQPTVSPHLPQGSQLGQPTVSSLLTQGNQLGQPTVSPQLPQGSQLGQPSSVPATVPGQSPAPKQPLTPSQPSALSHPPVSSQGQGQQEGHISIEATVDSAFTQNIIEEILDFERELKQLRQRAGREVKSVGTQEEMRRLRQGTQKMESFTAEIKDTTKEQLREVQDQKSLCFSLFAMAEECRSKQERDTDPNYHSLLQGRVLDPASSEKLKNLQQMSQALEQSVVEVDRILDTQWEEHLARKKREKRLQTPTGDTIYKSIRNNHILIASQRRQLEKVEEQLRALKLYNKVASRDLHSLSLFTGDKMSPLKGSQKPEVTLTSAVASGMTPEKISKLRDVLSQRKVPRVKSTSPANLSISRIVSLTPVKTVTPSPQQQPQHYQDRKHHLRPQQTPSGPPPSQLGLPSGQLRFNTSPLASDLRAQASGTPQGLLQAKGQSVPASGSGQRPASSAPTSFSGVAYFKHPPDAGVSTKGSTALSGTPSLAPIGVTKPAVGMGIPAGMGTPPGLTFGAGHKPNVTPPIQSAIPAPPVAGPGESGAVSSMGRQNLYEDITPGETEESTNEEDDDYDEEDNGYEDEEEEEDEEETGFGHMGQGGVAHPLGQVGSPGQMSTAKTGPGQGVFGLSGSSVFGSLTTGSAGPPSASAPLFKLPQTSGAASQAFLPVKTTVQTSTGPGVTTTTPGPPTASKDLFGIKTSQTSPAAPAEQGLTRSGSNGFNFTASKFGNTSSTSGVFTFGKTTATTSGSSAATATTTTTTSTHAAASTGPVNTGGVTMPSVFGQKADAKTGVTFGGPALFGEKLSDPATSASRSGSLFGSVATPSKTVGFSDLTGKASPEAENKNSGVTGGGASQASTQEDTTPAPSQSSPAATTTTTTSTATSATTTVPSPTSAFSFGQATAVPDSSPGGTGTSKPATGTTTTSSLFGGSSAPSTFTTVFGEGSAPTASTKLFGAGSSPSTTSSVFGGGQAPSVPTPGTAPSIFGGKSPTQGERFSFGTTPSTTTAGTSSTAVTSSAAVTSATGFSFIAAAASATPASTASAPATEATATTTTAAVVSAPSATTVASSEKQPPVYGGGGSTMSPSSTSDSTDATASGVPPSIQSSSVPTTSTASTTASSTTATATAPLFGSGESTATNSSLFGGGQSTPTPSLFAGAVVTTSTAPSLFGGASATSSSAPLFGTTATTPATTATTTSAFGGLGSSVFGGGTSSSSSASLFGGSTTSSSSSVPTFGFGGTSGTSASSGTLFGSPASTASSGVFGSGGGGGGGLFGSGGTTTTSASGTGLFGSGSSGGSVFGSGTTGGSVFGSGTAAGQTGGSVFGQPTTKSGFGFGQSPGGTQPSTGFGQSSSFGQPASSSSGPDFGFGGLGGKPSEEKAKQNVFGTPQVFGAAVSQSTSSLFGSGGSTSFGGTGSSFSTSSPRGFSGGSGSVSSTGFGVTSTAPPSTGFGAAPAFGSSPAFGGTAVFGARPAAAFGSSPAFGGAPAFGSVPSFSSPPGSTSAFGPSSTGGGFSSFAAAAAPSFGQLAQSSTPSSSFGGGLGGGFGSGQPSQSSPFGGGSVFGQASASPGFGGGQTPGFGSGSSFGANPAFSSYRG